MKFTRRTRLVITLFFVGVVACSSQEPTPESVSAFRSGLVNMPFPSAFEVVAEQVRATVPRLLADLSNLESFGVWRASAMETLLDLLTVDRTLIRGAAVANVHLQGHVQRDGYRIEGIDYPVEGGLRISAYVLVPDSAVRNAGVLLLHGHGNGGKEALIGHGGAPGVDAYQFDIADDLVRAGFVVFVPDIRSFGASGDNNQTTHYWYVRMEHLRGRVAMGIFLADAQSALDILSSHPRVDRSRLAVAGVSLGGELAILLGALDDRVTAVVGQAVVWDWVGTQLDVISCECQAIPNLVSELDASELAMLVAPTPLLLVQGANDSSYSPDVANQMVESTRSAYELFGAVQNLEFILHDGAHEWYGEPTVPWLNRWIGGGPGEESIHQPSH